MAEVIQPACSIEAAALVQVDFGEDTGDTVAPIGGKHRHLAKRIVNAASMKLPASSAIAVTFKLASCTTYRRSSRLPYLT